MLLELDVGGLVLVDEVGEVGEEEDFVVLLVLERGGGEWLVVEDGGGAVVVDEDAVVTVKLGRTPVAITDVTGWPEAVVSVEDIGGGLLLEEERGRAL